MPNLTYNELKELVTCAPELFQKEPRDPHNKDILTLTSGKSLSCSDLPAVKEIEMKTSLDEIDGNKFRTKDICKGTENVDRPNVVRKGNTGNEADGTCVNAGGNEARMKNISTQTMEYELITSNIAIKENLLQVVNILRRELHDLRVASSSWGNNIKEYLNERCLIFEEIKVRERSRLLCAKSDSEKVQELTKSLDILKKKMTSLSSENESLRKEIEAKDISFSEKELRYRNDLERQKQYATELESAKESFEAEQQIRFNSAIGRVMKEKEAALKKADEQLTNLKFLQEKNDEKLQVLFNEKERLRQEKDEHARKVLEARKEVDKGKAEMDKYIAQTEKRLEETERTFREQLENERKEAAMVLEAEKMKYESESSGSGSG